MRRVLGILIVILAACASAPVDEVAGSATRPLALTRPVDTPNVDTSRSSVDLDRIIFDTFGRGPRFSLETGRSDVIQSLRDAIQPIDAPRYQAGTAQTWLQEDDVVVGYVDPTGAAWAFAVRMLNQHEIVNDELGGQKVLISYCPLCGSGVVYDREVDGRELSFSNTSALFENDMVMVDRETGSYWWQVAGTGIVGPLTGQTLTPLAAQTTTWESWTAQHPQTALMERISGRSYDHDSFRNYQDQLDDKRTPFPVSDEVLDDPRLTPGTRVVALTVDGKALAWPTAPARTVETDVDGVDITIVLDGTGGSAFGADGAALPVRTAFWFAIRSSFPDVILGPE